MDKKIKIGAIAWGLPGGGVFAPQIAKKLNLDGIQLELGYYEIGYTLTQQPVIEGYLEAKEKYAIEYPTIVMNDVMYHEFINGKNTENGKIAYEQVELAVRAGEKLGIKKIMIPNFLSNLITEDEHTEHTIDYLKYACSLAADAGMYILTENGLNWKEQIQMLKDVGCSNMKIHFDTENFKFNYNYDQVEILKNLYPYMDNQLHVKDGNEFEGGKFLGEGNTRFFEQMAFLRENKYTGWIITENYYNIKPLRNQAVDNDRMSLIKRDIETIKKCFS